MAASAPSLTSVLKDYGLSALEPKLMDLGVETPYDLMRAHDLATDLKLKVRPGGLIY